MSSSIMKNRKQNYFKSNGNVNRSIKVLNMHMNTMMK